MSNITAGHVRVFQAVRSPHYDNITLASCSINGEPGVAIVMMDFVGEDTVEVAPLFVAITPGMRVVLEDGRSSGGEGEGGPNGSEESFHNAKEALRSSPA